MIELGQQVRVLNSKDVPTGVIKLKVGKGVCPSRAQQYSSNAAMANSNASGSPDAATYLSGKRVRIRQSLRVDVAVLGTGTLLYPLFITPRSYCQQRLTWLGPRLPYWKASLW